MFPLIDLSLLIFFFFFFNDTATTEIYTLSLHDALPIWAVFGIEHRRRLAGAVIQQVSRRVVGSGIPEGADRKSTRLNSSHSQISYAVFCLKKKKTEKILTHHRPHSATSYRRSPHANHSV